MKPTDQDHTDLNPPTIPPYVDESECCQSGCEDCVLDQYQADVRAYQRALKLWQLNQEKTNS